MKYLCLLRGINVGGKNKISMAELKICLEKNSFTSVSTYINSGNVFVESNLKSENEVERHIEALLLKNFTFDSELIKIRAVTPKDLKTIIEKAPKDFGTKPDTYHSDVLFPMNIESSEIMSATECREGVDAAWEGNSVVYYQRLSSQRTKSKLSKVISKPIYKSLTIRSWKTTIKLFALFAKS